MNLQTCFSFFFPFRTLAASGGLVSTENSCSPATEDMDTTPASLEARWVVGIVGGGGWGGVVVVVVVLGDLF